MKRFVIIIFCMLATASCGNSQKIDPEQLNETFRKELPVGTSRSTVAAFLEKHRLKYTDSKDISYDPGIRTLWVSITVPRFLTETDFLYAFEFNDEDNLFSYSMKNELSDHDCVAFRAEHGVTCHCQFSRKIFQGHNINFPQLRVLIWRCGIC